MNFVDGKFIRVDESQGEEKLTQEAPAPNSSEFEEGVKIGAPGETCNQGGEMVIETEQDVNSSIENVNNMNGDLHGYTDGENSGDIETKNLGDKDGDSTDNNDKVDTASDGVNVESSSSSSEFTSNKKQINAGLTIDASATCNTDVFAPPTTTPLEDDNAELNEDDFKPLTDAVQANLPSLRGKISEGPEGHGYIIKGMWGMNDNAHKAPDGRNTSEWELILTEPVIDSPTGWDGKYGGYFMIKTKQGSTRNADSVRLKFCPIKGEAIFMGKVKQAYNVVGKGANQFGKFKIQGVVTSDNSVHLYKIYEPAPGAANANIKRRKSSDGSNKLPTTPRISTPRASAVKAEKVIADSQKSLTGSSRTSSLQRQNSNTSVVSDGGNRSQRKPQSLLKCSDLLKEMMKVPSAQWFAVPVDPIKMNIPDYPSIITDPMDFGTIRDKLDSNMFETPEEFAADMRLVFRNAMTYNSSRDNIVHIAARELSGKFEEKYRQYSAVWNNQVPDAPVHPHGTRGPAAATKLPKASAPASRLQKQTKQPVKAPVPRQSSVPVQRQRSSTGGSGRAPLATGPPAMDVTAQAQMQMMRDMERRMAEMQAELNTLRQQQSQSYQPPYQAPPQQYVPPAPPARQPRQLPQRRASAPAPVAAPPVAAPPVASLEPLTFEEKKTLIGQIQTLDQDKMEKVVEIIQAAMPPDRPDNGEEVEIPIDELDTATLRRLQEFVEGKKRPTAPVAAPPAKKSKVSPSGPPKGTYIPSKSQSSSALDTMQTQKAGASAAQLDNVSSSTETTKRPRSDSIEFDELVSGSTELMNDGSGLG